MRKLVIMCCAIVFFGCKNDKNENVETEEAVRIHSEVTSAIPQEQRSDILKQSISRGKEIYSNFCASCHLASGEGIQGTFPPLAKSNWITDKRQETIHAVKFGLSGPITVNGKEYDNLMPSPGLTDEEVTDVLNYIATSWGNDVKEPFTKEEVIAIKK